MNATAPLIAPEASGPHSRRWTKVAVLCAIGAIWNAALCVDSAAHLAAPSVVGGPSDNSVVGTGVPLGKCVV